MSLIIVTNRCFLACERVTSITIQEHVSEAKKSPRRLKTGKKKTKSYKTPTRFTLVISYIPESSSSSNSNGNFKSSGPDDEASIELDVFGEKETFALFSEVVHEIREQCPDELYLDKLVDKMLNDSSDAVPPTIKAKITNPHDR